MIHTLHDVERCAMKPNTSGYWTNKHICCVSIYLIQAHCPDTCLVRPEMQRFLVLLVLSWFMNYFVLSPCIWHYIFLSASQLLVLLGNWCFLLSIKKCQWEKGYSTQGQKCSWTHLQTFTNILIRYFVNSLSLTFSKDLICVVWEGFMVPVRWLSWLCGSWSYVRVRRLKTKNDNRGGPYLFRGTESTHCLMMTYGDWCAFDGNQSTEYHVSQKQSDHFDVLLPMLGTWLRLMLPSKKKRSGTTENMVYK